MSNLIKIILICNLIFANDGEGPLFTNIIPISDFFYENPIQIDIQAIDQDGIDEIILYYKFNDDEDYKSIKMDKEVNYSAIIPSFEVKGNQVEYYFLGSDVFGNQRKFPYNAEEQVLNLPIIKPSDKIISDHEVNLIQPLENSASEDISIIILSIYNPDKLILKENIEIILNNQNITKDCNISNDLITYVPSSILNDEDYDSH